MAYISHTIHGSPRALAQTLPALVVVGADNERSLEFLRAM